jgi:hypothetical protein
VSFVVLKTIFILFRDYRPLMFFGLVDLGMAALSVVLFMPILRKFLYTSEVPRFPTLIVAVSFAILAMLSFAVGCILDTIKK